MSVGLIINADCEGWRLEAGLTQMIDAQLHFESICGLGVGTHHDASVVYQNIYLFLLWKTTEGRLIKKKNKHLVDT